MVATEELLRNLENSERLGNLIGASLYVIGLMARMKGAAGFSGRPSWILFMHGRGILQVFPFSWQPQNLRQIQPNEARFGFELAFL